MEHAYVITKNHFIPDEVNYPQLKEITDNVILEYDCTTDLKYFIRSLFEMDRLNFNIGIRLKSSNIASDYLINEFIKNIRGFKINLGVWIQEDNINNIKNIRDKFKLYKDNFIIGFISDFQLDCYRWGEMGDIETYAVERVSFIQNMIRLVVLNTDFKTIYEENKLHPILSNY